jgi:hypothetical protein
MCLPSRLALSQYSKSRLHLLRVWNIFALLVLRFDAFLLMTVEMSRSLGVFVRHDLACFAGCLGHTQFRSADDNDKLPIRRHNYRADAG